MTQIVKNTVNCTNEYDRLNKVIVCEPRFMKIRDVINETQKHYKEDNINIPLALQQHEAFIHLLKNHDIDVIKLPAKPTYNEQVFTRDIGFTLGNTIFIAEMASSIRQGEETVLKSWIDDHQLSNYNLNHERIEGGDVIIDRESIYVGMSSRTHEQSALHLQKLLTDYKIQPIRFEEKYLHLDCVFNIISPTEALIFPDAIGEEDRKQLSERYDLITVTPEEQFTLGTNVLSIGHKKIISLPMNKQVNEELRKRGYEVIECDISEIIKSGGSFRCCTLPILRTEGSQ